MLLFIFLFSIDFHENEGSPHRFLYSINRIVFQSLRLHKDQFVPTIKMSTQLRVFGLAHPAGVDEVPQSFSWFSMFSFFVEFERFILKSTMYLRQRVSRRLLIRKAHSVPPKRTLFTMAESTLTSFFLLTNWILFTSIGEGEPFYYPSLQRNNAGIPGLFREYSRR